MHATREKIVPNAELLSIGMDFLTMVLRRLLLLRRALRPSANAVPLSL